MATNPKPYNCISLISSYSTIAQTYTNRINRGLRIDALKMKPRMIWVLFEKLISLTGLFLNMHR